MFDAAKAKLARRRALKHVGRRVARPWARDPAERRVLVVLPSGSEDAHEAWRFVSSLGLPAARLTPVVLTGEVTFVPAEYISRLVRLDDEHIGSLGLPKPAFAARVWDPSPDVAFSLAPTFDLAAAYLVGASPAAFRVGVYDEEAEPFFDLMVASGAGIGSAFASLRAALARIEPPVLPLTDEV